MKDNSVPPFHKGQIVVFRRKALKMHPAYAPNGGKLLVVTKVIHTPRGSQTGWCINARYQGQGKILNEYEKPVRTLKEFDSGWFEPYQGGTVLAGEEK